MFLLSGHVIVSSHKEKILCLHFILLKHLSFISQTFYLNKAIQESLKLYLKKLLLLLSTVFKRSCIKRFVHDKSDAFRQCKAYTCCQTRNKT